MELDVDALPPAPVPVGPRISAFPPVLFDLAFLVDAGTPAADFEAGVREAAGELLESVRLFDVYTGSQVPEGRKSLAYSLTLRAPDRTLSGEEAAAVRAQIVAAARAGGAELRG
jgi:phenylalanyl-tRNA synthetase beta chain